MIPIDQIIALGLIIFFIGLFGVLFRKNLIIILMAIELMLNGVNIILAGIGYHMKSPVGSILRSVCNNDGCGRSCRGIRAGAILF